MERQDIPKISVVTPSFNQGKYIEDTILSVLDQDYPNYEFFICDAGSKDETVEVIKRHDKHITWWCSEKDKGHTDAINKGLRRSTGEILCYLNSDDFFLPNAFHYIAQAYRANPDAGLYTGNGIIVDGRKAHPKIYMREIGFTFDSMLRGSCYLLQPSTFVNRKAWDKLGEFDDSLRFAMDLDYWLRVAKDFDVVLLNEPLSAWRMHEDIKTVHGGLVRWTELWRIYRKFTKDQLTPGLLAEFFSVLQSPLISEQLGMDVRGMGEKCFNAIYAEMQRVLRVEDCVPVGKGNIFKPTPPAGAKSVFRAYPEHALVLSQLQPQLRASAEFPASLKPRTAAPEPAVAAPAISNQRGTSQPRVDIVLQATGSHAWAVSGGWENAARKLGVLNRVFRPQANWGNPDVHDDDGLFRYLANPQADVILLAGFDWHSQMLHTLDRWQDRWRQTRALKLLYVQESVLHNEKLSGSKIMEKCFLRAAELVDAILYTDLNDRALIEASGKPALFQPFGVDDQVFNLRTPFAHRIARAFFRGKHQPFAGQTTSYQDRRALIQHLLDHQALELVSYKDGPITPDDLAMDFNRYQVAVNFPSVFSNHPTRVYEAMACGCALVTNRTGVASIDREFEHGRHLLYYSNRDELLNAVRELSANPTRAAKIADEGCRYAIEKHALHRRLDQAIQWLDTVPRRAHAPASAASAQVSSTAPHNLARKLVIDGVIFHLQQGRPHGISRVWRNLLEELGRTSLAEDIILLDRDGTAPVIPGIRRRFVGGYDYRWFEDDSLRVQKWCDEEDAALFISTYHTYAENTPTMVMLHDMIPEVTGQDLSLPEWRAKARAIEKSCAFFAVSQATINDFRQLYPQLAERPVVLTPNAVGDEMRAVASEEVRCFRERHGIEKPYFLLVGHRAIYKNAILFFRAFALLPDRHDFEIVCVGGASELEPAFKPFTRGVRCHLLRLNNAELCAAYTGATALVYPSQYEGFGLPILEAQKCDCPVITCRNSSIPEVAGASVLYVGDTDVAGMQEALRKVRQPESRRQLVAAGRANTQRFSWSQTAHTVTQSLRETRERARNLPLNPGDPIDTIGRLTTALSFGSERGKTLSRYLSQLVHLYRGGSRYDRELAARCEQHLAGHLGAELPALRMELAPESDCDHFLLYALGIVAEQRHDTAAALRFHTEALKRASDSTIAKFRVRVGLRLIGLAARCGQGQTAESLLERVVVPAQQAARERVSLEEEARELLGNLAGEIVKNAAVRSEPSENNRLAARPAVPTSPPLVTALVSTYNSERFMRGCLEDLEAQTIADRLQIIVVDSGSTENEADIVREFQQRYGNIEYVRTEREPLYAAWNRAAHLARGKYLTNANTDDRHRRDAFERMVAALETNPHVALVYADCLATTVENETYDTAASTRKLEWLDFDARALLEKGCFVGPQPMWRREVHEEHGYFDPEFPICGDYEFWLRLARTRDFLHLRETLGLYLESPGSVEHANREQAIRESRAAQDRHRAAILSRGRGTGVLPVVANRLEASPTKPAVAAVGNLDAARAALRKKDHPAAWQATLAALKARPFHPEAYLLLAEIALAAGNSVAARQCATHAQQLAPGWKAPKQFLKSNPRGNAKHDWLVLPAEIGTPNSAVHTPHPEVGSRLSVCLIVKNEERFLAQCLQSVRDLAHQIVVVDTGSTDRTVEIAKAHGAEVHTFAWCDDFSAARNAALEHATGDWILSLDADEELPAASHEALRKEIRAAKVMAYRLPITDAGREAEGCSYVPRLFRNAPGLSFSGRVHEHAFASVEERRKSWGLENRLGAARLVHHGYTREVTQDRSKVERNLRLLELALVESPGDPNLLMNCGLELVRSGDLSGGLERYREAFRLLSALPPAQVSPELRETLLTQLCTHWMATQDYAEIVCALASPLAKSGGLTASLHFALGLAQTQLSQFGEAAAQMRQCLAKRNQPALAPVNKEIHQGGPHHCLALCLAKLNDDKAADEAFRAGLAEAPQSRLLRLDYARFLHKRGRGVDALQLLNAQVTENCRDAEVWRVGGEIALSQPDYLAFANDWTGEALKHLPEDRQLVAQRAEVLLLRNDVDAARDLWRPLCEQERQPRHLAALVLCESLNSHSSVRLNPGPDEVQTSGAFVEWYQRLVAMGAGGVVERLNARRDRLRETLPTAARLLDAALAEVEQR